MRLALRNLGSEGRSGLDNDLQCEAEWLVMLLILGLFFGLGWAVPIFL